MVSAATNGVLLIGLGRVWARALLQVIASTTFIIAAWVMLPRLGLVAVPIAGIIAFIIDPLISLPYALALLGRQSEHLATAPEPPAARTRL